MKKTIGIILLLGISLGLRAQDWQDAYLFSENNYIGTARSAAMGNAMTALGGDPGSLTMNPAGSSVASYSQFYISSGLSISSAFATGTIPSGSTSPIGFGDEISSKRARFKMPSLGYVMNFDTGRRSGLKRMSLGFVFNTTNDYTHRFNAGGVNSHDSFGASIASSADGYLTNVMANADWYATGDASQMPAWIDMTGYRAGLISGVTSQDGAYIALSEVIDENGQFRIAAPLYQEYGRQTRGYKGDLIMNWSANWSDKFYLGVNIGIVNSVYGMVEYWKEQPNNPSDFAPIEFSDGTTGRFEAMTMKRDYSMEGNGIYAKLGVIWLPVPTLRLGAAIQTPTAFTIIERYSYTGQSEITGQYRGAVSSPEDTWGYGLTQPFRYNLGAAFALGKIALVSADFESVNYAGARFRNYRGDEYDFGYYDFSSNNENIRNYLGKSRSVRLGLELKPLPAIAVRTGYIWQGSGIADGSEASKKTVSFGLGYSSSGSFYADFALRFRFMPTEFIVPYSYYYAPDSSDPYYKVIDDGILTPEIAVDSTIADAFVTVGWRF